MNQNEFLKEKANFIRDDVMAVALANGAGHIAPSLSCVDILVALYYDVMRYDEKNPYDPQRDRLIFSKAHGCYGLYAILADKGLVTQDVWRNFYKQNGPLMGCSERKVEFGIEANCGSLGHGLPMAVGLAFGAKLQEHRYHVFCVMGDGEFQEGTSWEALQYAVKHQVGNLTIIVDQNRLQAMDLITNVLDSEDDDLLNRLKGFGMAPEICPGHDTVKLVELLGSLRRAEREKPSVVLAQTIKGYGIKCMENVPKFHFRLPTENEMQMGKSYD
ncbi:MAG: transketolase [Planctomycetes bacterium]|nr:transketolase [Planctomycetota bacterium]